MQTFKLSALALALSSLTLSAHAMRMVTDDDLSLEAAQDGVTIAADLQIKVGALTWTDTDTNGGSVSFNNITIKGMLVATIDVFNATTFGSIIGSSMSAYGLTSGEITTQIGQLVSNGVYDGVSDVVQIAFPNANMATALTPTVTIGSITNGNSTKSYGALEVKNLDLQGTKVWLWAH